MNRAQRIALNNMLTWMTADGNNSTNDVEKAFSQLTDAEIVADMCKYWSPNESVANLIEATAEIRKEFAKSRELAINILYNRIEEEYQASGLSEPEFRQSED